MSQRLIALLLAALLPALLAPAAAVAQQQQPTISGWQTGAPMRGSINEGNPTQPAATNPSRGSGEPKAGPPGTLSLTALLTDEGQKVDQGLVWRVFEDKIGPDGRNRLISQHREAAPMLKLDPGDYLINAAFGRAQLTRKITVRAGAAASEKFVLNAGGLRLTAYVGTKGTPAPANSVLYDILTDERDQLGNRTKVLGGVKPGVIIRLNSGIYHIVSTLGDANATVTTNVTVEPGKLTEAAVAHAAAKVTLKLVARPGGEALADTHWSITSAEGEVVKSSVGALPTHILAPGTYTVSARSGERVFKREFTLQMDQAAEVEVVME